MGHTGRPAFFLATFNSKTIVRPHPAGGDQGPFPRGTMWLNGHNLGRYPEKIAAPAIWLPECWLKDGETVLVVFDEEGAVIDPVKLEVEKAASREVIEVSQECNASVPLVVPC